MTLGISAPALDLSAEIRPLQDADASLRPLRKLAEGSHPHYRLRDGLLYRILPEGDRVVVPSSLQNMLIEEYHDHTGHLGVGRTLGRLSARYWFPHMARKVR